MGVCTWDKQTSTMKDHLVIFDFDNTIKRHSPGYTMGVSHLFPGKKIPQELEEAFSKNPNRREAWDNLNDAVMKMLNELNLPKEMIVEGYANDGFLIEEMDDVIKTFYKDHDILIVSDGQKHSIEEFMKKHGLHQYLKGIFAKPYVIKENGQVVLEDMQSRKGQIFPEKQKLQDDHLRGRWEK